MSYFRGVVDVQFKDFEAGTQVYLCIKCFVESQETGKKQLRDITLKTSILDEDVIDNDVLSQIPTGYRVCADIRVNGYLITFDNDYTSASVIVGLGAKNFKFHNCNVITCKVGKRKYLCIKTDSDGVEFNLRKTFRVNMNNTTANYSVLPSMVQRKCFIKDLSVRGAGLLIDQSQDISLNDTLQIQFQLDDDGRGANGITLYTLTCKVIRIVDEGRNWHCGCILITAPNIDKVVMQRQREELRAIIR